MDFLARNRRRHVDTSEVPTGPLVTRARSAVSALAAADERAAKLEVGQRGRGAVAVLIDHLEALESVEGFSTAAMVWDAVGRRLEQVVSADDVLVPLEGRGHLVLAADVLALRDLQKLAGRLHASLAAPFVGPNGSPWRVTASIGIAPSFDRADDFRTLGGRAVATARASAELGGGHTLLESEHTSGPRSPWVAVQEIHRAFDNGELQAHFQPMFDLTSGRVEAAEALIRWHHRERGLLYPATFLADVGLAGLDDRLTELVVGQAADYAANMAHEWGRPVPVAINVGGWRRRPEDLVAVVSEAMARSQLAPRSLVIELPERLLATSATARGVRTDGVVLLQLLAAAGIDLAIDGGAGDATTVTSLPGQPTISWYKLSNRWTEKHRRPGLPGVVAQLRGHFGADVPMVGLGLADDDAVEDATKAGLDWGQGFALHRPVDGSRIDGIRMALPNGHAHVERHRV